MPFVRSLALPVLSLAVLVSTSCGRSAPLVEVLPAGDTVDTVGPYVVNATIDDGDGVIVRAEVLWSNGSPGAVSAAPLVRDEQSDRWQAQLPGQPAGTTVRYVVEVEDDEGYVIVLPPKAMPGEPPAAYEFRVGP